MVMDLEDEKLTFYMSHIFMSFLARKKGLDNLLFLKTIGKRKYNELLKKSIDTLETDTQSFVDELKENPEKYKDLLELIDVARLGMIINV